MIADLGDTGATELRYAFIVTKQVRIDSLAHLIAFAAPFSQQLFVFRGTLAGLLFFLLDFRGFGFQLGMGSLDFFFTGVGVEHQLKNLVFIACDFLLGELDFVQQSLVLFVGFDGERLVAVLGNLAAKVGDCGVVFAAGGFVCLCVGLGSIQLSLGAGQFQFNGSNAFGEFGNLVLEAADFLVRFLQPQQVFVFRKH